MQQLQYSHLVDPAEYDAQGLCNGIPLYVHNYPQNEDAGAIRCQKDWSDLVEPTKHYKGGLGPRWNFISVTVPECLPERLQIISYANEFAFLYDDQTECCDDSELNASNDHLQSAFLEGANNGSIAVKDEGKKVMQASILKEMMDIDKDRAITTLKGWAEFLRLAGGRQHNRHFASMADYVPYRSIDGGKWFWYGIVTFGMAITIPSHEMEICDELMMPAWAALSLQNDIFSWEKERDAATLHGKQEVVNGVWVLMGEHSIAEDEALKRLRTITQGYVSAYEANAKLGLENEELSLDLRRYLQAILWSLSGNAVWSTSCPRYGSADAEAYNSAQLALLSRTHDSKAGLHVRSHEALERLLDGVTLP